MDLDAMRCKLLIASERVRLQHFYYLLFYYLDCYCLGVTCEYE